MIFFRKDCYVLAHLIHTTEEHIFDDEIGHLLWIIINKDLMLYKCLSTGKIFILVARKVL